MKPVLKALGDGIGRVGRAPAVLGGAWLMIVLVSLPPMLMLRSSIEGHLGESLEADLAASAVNYDWMQELAQQPGGAGIQLTPRVIGFAAVLDNLSAFVDNEPRPLLVTATAAASLVLWVFLTGGIIDRYARVRPTHARGFFAASGAFFGRFLRLTVVAAVVYAVMFGPVHAWLFDDVYGALTRDVTVERTAFLTRLGLYAIFIAALSSVALVFDYAKVRAVVEDRRSMLGALVSAVRFLSRNAATAIPLYVLNLTMAGAVLAAYALVAPGAGSTGLSMWMGFAIAQLYLVGRVWAKLLFWASETALFQSRLAHAGYVATAMPQWPDSPNVEAIRRSRL
jgi:hypothetical protein